MVMPQRSPTASSVIARPPRSCSARSTPSDELGARVRVREERPRGDEVRLDQRAPVRPQIQLLEPLADDGADALGIVAVAVPDDDARGLRGVHAGRLAP